MTDIYLRKTNNPCYASKLQQEQKWLTNLTILVPLMSLLALHRKLTQLQIKKVLKYIKIQLFYSIFVVITYSICSECVSEESL